MRWSFVDTSEPEPEPLIDGVPAHIVAESALLAEVAAEETRAAAKAAKKKAKKHSGPIVGGGTASPSVSPPLISRSHSPSAPAPARIITAAPPIVSTTSLPVVVATLPKVLVDEDPCEDPN